MNRYFCSGEYTCQIDDGRGVKTSGYLYVEGIERKTMTFSHTEKMKILFNLRTTMAL